MDYFIINTMRNLHAIKLQKCMRNYLLNLNGLPSFKCDKTQLSYKDINVFNTSISHKKKDNDKNNNIRENIILCVLKNLIPDRYFKISKLWRNIKESIHTYISDIGVHDLDNLVINRKAGRKNNYDFEIICNNNETYKVEFKFNIDKIDDAPQYASPAKPSNFLSISYEEFFYDNYLSSIIELNKDLKLPNKEEYLKTINNVSPKCVKDISELYYKGAIRSSKYTGIPEHIEFYKKTNEITSESIKEFICKADLDIDKLSKYLLESQKDKIYMLYKNGKIIKEIKDIESYMLVSYRICEKNKNRYIVLTKNGKYINVLLRWKNGNGVAFPSFQIGDK
jgi:hypothetical protein